MLVFRCDVRSFACFAPLLTVAESVQDSLGRLADVHAVEEAQADQDAWAALSKECDPSSRSGVCTRMSINKSADESRRHGARHDRCNRVAFS